MLKLLGSLLIAGGGGMAWYLQWGERRRKRDALSGLQAAFRRMGEEVRMSRTPLPVLLRALAADCGPPVSAFFAAAAGAAGAGENLPRVWREEAEALPLSPGDRAAVAALANSLQGDEENICKGILHVIHTLEKSASEAERKRPEEEKRAAALWFSASALLVILFL